MPFKSRAQQAYFNRFKDRLEGEGVNVDEWNKASKGLKLPDKVKSKPVDKKKK